MQGFEWPGSLGYCSQWKFKYFWKTSAPPSTEWEKQCQRLALGGVYLSCQQHYATCLCHPFIVDVQGYWLKTSIPLPEKGGIKLDLEEEKGIFFFMSWQGEHGAENRACDFAVCWWKLRGLECGTAGEETAQSLRFSSGKQPLQILCYFSSKSVKFKQLKKTLQGDYRELKINLGDWVSQGKSPQIFQALERTLLLPTMLPAPCPTRVCWIYKALSWCSFHGCPWLNPHSSQCQHTWEWSFKSYGSILGANLRKMVTS